MKKILFLFILISFSANAEKVEVTVTEKHKHTGNFKIEKSCQIAEEKAKKKALMETLGEKISTQVSKNCSEIDGEYECERNQVSLFELYGHISYSVINEYDDKINDVYFCEVTIKGKVEPIIKNKDPNFHFDTTLNQNILRSNEILEININTSTKMYMYIFQWLPYLDKKRNKQVTRIFPNQKYNVNINNLIINNIKLQYKAHFPENVKEERVYEYLVFIASDEEIAFIEEFTDMDGLNRVYYNSKLKMEKYTTGYTIIN